MSIVSRAGAVAMLALVVHAAGFASAQQRAIPADQLRSGITFAGDDVRAMQQDEFANPGMLWVERGAKLWSEPAGRSRTACAGCHGDASLSMRGVAARYPAYDTAARRVVDLPGRIDACRTRHQQAPALAAESDDLLALATFVAHQSRGMPMSVKIDAAARASFDRGRAFYYQRHGQMNMSCAQCHEQSWGRRLLRETLSQGHPTAFPAYRLEWQTLGSLDRRLRACLFGIRAAMPAPGSPQLVDLALFLAWRAEGLPIETPGVRR